jgi:hypothetical protein
MNGYGSYLETRVAADMKGDDVDYPNLEGSHQYQYRYHYDGEFGFGETNGHGEEWLTRYHPTQVAAGEEQRPACRERYVGDFSDGSRDGHGVLTAATAIPKAEDAVHKTSDHVMWGHKEGMIDFDRVQWDILWGEPDWDANEKEWGEQWSYTGHFSADQMHGKGSWKPGIKSGLVGKDSKLLNAMVAKHNALDMSEAWAAIASATDDDSAKQGHSNVKVNYKHGVIVIDEEGATKGLMNWKRRAQTKIAKVRTT